EVHLRRAALEAQGGLGRVERDQVRWRRWCGGWRCGGRRSGRRAEGQREKAQREEARGEHPPDATPNFPGPYFTSSEKVFTFRPPLAVASAPVQISNPAKTSVRYQVFCSP